MAEIELGNRLKGHLVRRRRMLKGPMLIHQAFIFQTSKIGLIVGINNDKKGQKKVLTKKVENLLVPKIIGVVVKLRDISLSHFSLIL